MLIEALKIEEAVAGKDKCKDTKLITRITKAFQSESVSNMYNSGPLLFEAWEV